jgi:integrase
MMATGMRIGEAAGLAWDAVDLDAGTVEVRAAVVRITGQGLTRKTTKTDTGQRTLILPTWCTDMLRTRAARPDRTGSWQDWPVFPAPLGGWRDPSNIQSDLRAAFDNAGFDWVTSHVFRKSVASVMDSAGLSSRAAADQLGQRQHVDDHRRLLRTQRCSTPAQPPSTRYSAPGPDTVVGVPTAHGRLREP